MTKTASLYRMYNDQHHCPFGTRAKFLLESKGFSVDDHKLKTPAETEAFKTEHGVKTTPQVFIEGQRIGGYEDLRRHFGLHVRDKNALTYRPVLMLFAMALLISLAISYLVLGTVLSFKIIEWFIANAMCLLALQKLQDVNGFANQFLGYDLLAQKYPPYASFYPYAEGLAGVLMLAGVLHWLSAPLALFIASIGAVSVFKAVYLDKRTLKCACVGGGQNVPLGFLSLTENLMMIGMGVWMLAKLV
jgi:glutaredoxin